MVQQVEHCSGQRQGREQVALVDAIELLPGHFQHRLLVSRTLGEFEELLEPHGFMRIHRSHLINLDCVTRYIRGRGGQVEMTDGSLLDVSRYKKDEFLKRLM